MFGYTGLLWIIGLVAFAQAQTLNETSGGVAPLESGMWRQGRRRSVLADTCTTNSGTTGTCLTRFKCMRQSGTVNGYCGTYGVCCETNLQVGATTRQKRSIIKSPATFATDLITYTVEAMSNNVQQLRIDFEQFEMAQPVDTDGVLDCQDYFEAGGFKLCGVNNGQHLYLPFNAATGVEQVTITFAVPSKSTGTNWRLIVTQLEGPPISSRRRLTTTAGFGASTNSLQDLRDIFASHHADYELLAPPGCQQYYTGLTGTIRSFNFQSAVTSNYMPDLSYNICIQSSTSASMIEYSFSQFSMSIQDGTAEGYDEFCHPTVHTAGRQEDYLMIPQGILAKNMAYQPTYYCGTNENLVVYASPPYLLHFSSDDLTLDRSVETGFSMTYRLRNSLL
ncbi:uncharacterized protein Dana_GF13688 [Drosophila ananassae]|uniref:CUB domain-containing protein n=1 Tax=Drosophila ananassae TaxID=7217 RepID=B3MGX3_DROAN|nr:uncharacterized protein LOC6496525 [Drosophila ananassae]EDV37891.1 uncharacterized protein Dana_GF13688 [Drosophila ananassae]